MYRVLAAAGAFALLAGAALAANLPAAPAGAPPNGMWDLRDLYPTPEAWTAAHDKVKAQAERLDQYKGTLGKSADSMLKALSAISDVRKEALRLSVYASLKGD
jgi:oligoendopeptidase F